MSNNSANSDDKVDFEKQKEKIIGNAKFVAKVFKNMVTNMIKLGNKYSQKGKERFYLSYLTPNKFISNITNFVAYLELLVALKIITSANINELIYLFSGLQTGDVIPMVGTKDGAPGVRVKKDEGPFKYCRGVNCKHRSFSSFRTIHRIDLENPQPIVSVLMRKLGELKNDLKNPGFESKSVDDIIKTLIKQGFHKKNPLYRPQTWSWGRPRRYPAGPTKGPRLSGKNSTRRGRTGKRGRTGQNGGRKTQKNQKSRKKSARKTQRKKGTYVPTRYVPKSLSEKNKAEQRKELKKSRKAYKNKKNPQYHTRKKMVSFQSKVSPHVVKARKVYGIEKIKPSAELAKATKCTQATLRRIEQKGQGAYYSSGSRPNQTAHSWGRARLASAITGGKASAVDLKLLEKGCKPSSKALKMAKKAKGYGQRRVPQTKL
jgi:hypothetical protein